MSLVTKGHLSSLIELFKNLLSFKADKSEVRDLSDKVEADLNVLSDRVEEVQDSSFNRITFSKEVEFSVSPKDVFTPGATLIFKESYTKQELVDLYSIIANDDLFYFSANEKDFYANIYNENDHYELNVLVRYPDETGENYAWGFRDGQGAIHSEWTKVDNDWSQVIENIPNSFTFTLWEDKNYNLDYCSEDIALRLLAIKTSENQITTIEAANTDKAIPLKAGNGIEFTSENNELVVSSNISAFNKASIIVEKTLEEYLQPGNLISFRESYDQNTLKAIYDYMPGYDVIELREYVKDENMLRLTTYVSNHDGRYGLCVQVNRGYYQTTTEYYYYGYVDYSGNQHLNWCLVDRGYVIEENLSPPSFVATDNFSYYQYEYQGFAESLFEMGGHYSLSASDLNKDLVLIPGEGINLMLQDNGILIEGSAKIEVDSELSNTSVNPVQNQVITNELQAITNEIENELQDVKTLIDTKIEEALSTLARIEEVTW